VADAVLETLMLRRLTLLTTALALVVAAPAAAAPTLSDLAPCYVAAQESQRQSVPVVGGGFSALAPVDIFIDDVLQAQPTTGPKGELNGSVLAPFVEEGQREFTLRVTEPNLVGNTVVKTAQVTRLAVTQSPESASTRQRVRFRGSGFATGQPVYAHYVFGGKSRKTVRIGVPRGACGLFSVRVKQFPFKNSPRVGEWTIWFDQLKAFDQAAPLRVPLTVKVRRAIRRASAPAR
jgi:hypothetical protein